MIDATEAGAPPDVRCPGCHSIDWRHDGFQVAEHDHRIDIGRTAPSGFAIAPWTCGACGRQLDNDNLSRALSRLQFAHWD